MKFFFKLTVGAVTLLTNASFALANTGIEECKPTGFSIVGNKFGRITEFHCVSEKDYLTRYVLNDGQELLRSKHSVSFTSDNSSKLAGYKDGTLFIFQDSSDIDLACPARMFLLDLTGTKPHVYAFGVKNACAEYHWSSWGKKRSVIAIKDNIRFTYSKGKLTPPPDDFGDGSPFSRRFPEDGKPLRMWPFVEELPIP